MVHLSHNPMNQNFASRSALAVSPGRAVFMLIAFAGALLLATGCRTHGPSMEQVAHDATNGVTSTNALSSNSIPSTNFVSQSLHQEFVTLREGDTVRVTFPDAPNLNINQPIRRDGFLVMPIVGDIKAAGKTPDELKADILKLVAGQITSQEVTVELMSSAFPVFVTGAVVSPGKLMSDHPITVLEAIMERGGFNYTTANLKDVRVLRQDNGRLISFSVDMKAVMKGKKSEQFFLKPLDIVYIKEKFNWF